MAAQKKISVPKICKRLLHTIAKVEAARHFPAAASKTGAPSPDASRCNGDWRLAPLFRRKRRIA
jgi:hypothetical protein